MKCLDFSNISNEWVELIETIPESIRDSVDKQVCDAQTTYEPALKILPVRELRLASMRYFRPSETRVVIIGQDPYINPEQPMGLSFSVPDGVRVPPSLKNIYKELISDIPGFVEPKSGNLTRWTHQGVLLLNASLTVLEKNSNSHKPIWNGFMNCFLEIFSKRNPDVVYILMGREAQALKKYITKGVFIETAHPSPLARGAFNGSKPFSKANIELIKLGREPIDWCL